MGSENVSKKEKKFISLVIYLHDAAPYVKYFLSTIIPVIETNFEQYELVCVDDDCQDGTVEVKGLCGKQADPCHGKCGSYEFFPGAGKRYECRQGYCNRRFCL